MDAPIRVDLNFAATMVVLHVLLELSLQSTTTRGSVLVEGISSSLLWVADIALPQSTQIRRSSKIWFDSESRFTDECERTGAVNERQLNS